YHDSDPDKKAFGGRVVIKMKNGEEIADELERANAHPAGAIPFVRENYVKKFDMLTEKLITKEERDRFISVAERLKDLTAREVDQLTVEMPFDNVKENKANDKGIF
ncbi:MAG: MmgE/PrpD family protein, partial [Bacteroidota bacterium]